jgi:alpha-glucosidase
MEAVVFQMTWPGCPTIYYGDEAGLVGWTDPDNRRTYPWGIENMAVLDFHRKIIALRKRLPVLRRGSVEFLHSEYGILSYGRFDKNEKVAVIINNNPNIRSITIPLWKIGVAKNSRMELLMLTENDNFSTDSMSYEVVDGFMRIGMHPQSSVILREI